MTLKQWHRMAEMATNNTKMGWKHDNNTEKRNSNAMGEYWEWHGFLWNNNANKTAGFEIQTRDVQYVTPLYLLEGLNHAILVPVFITCSNFSNRWSTPPSPWLGLYSKQMYKTKKKCLTCIELHYNTCITWEHNDNINGFQVSYKHCASRKHLQKQVTQKNKIKSNLHKVATLDWASSNQNSKIIY